jgi:hypothetical protein
MVSPKNKTTSSNLNIADKTIASISLRQIKVPGFSRSLTTPDVYKAGIYAIWGATVLLAGTVISTVTTQRNIVEELGFNTTPSVYHAQRIRDSVADLDANVANLLLVPPGGNASAEESYQERKKKLASLVVQSSENITIPAERDYLSAIILGVNNYIEKVQEARDFHAQKNTEASLKAYREAQLIVGDDINGLMKDANQLDRVNFQALTTAYEAGQSAVGRQSLMLLFSGVVLLGTLISIQLMLAKWNRRLLNPALLGATVIAAFFILDTFVSLSTVKTQLKIAKVDAFDSLHALRQSRSIAYSLNADESRYLLDNNFAKQHEMAFSSKVKRLASIGSQDPVGNATTYQAQLEMIASQGKATAEFTGFFGTQLNNITFPGECKILEH